MSALGHSEKSALVGMVTFPCDLIGHVMDRDDRVKDRDHHKNVSKSISCRSRTTVPAIASAPKITGAMAHLPNDKKDRPIRRMASRDTAHPSLIAAFKALHHDCQQRQFGDYEL
jgi:hypothetical protein